MAFQYGQSNKPYQSMGVKPKTPVVSKPVNTLPQNQQKSGIGGFLGSAWNSVKSGVKGATDKIGLTGPMGITNTHSAFLGDPNKTPSASSVKKDASGNYASPGWNWNKQSNNWDKGSPQTQSTQSYPNSGGQVPTSPSPLLPLGGQQNQQSTQATGGAMTSDQLAQQQKNAELMKQYGQGNYTIDAQGNVLPKNNQNTSANQVPANVGGNNQSYPGGVQNAPSAPPPATTPPVTDAFTTNIGTLTDAGQGKDSELESQIKSAADEMERIKNEYAQKGVNIDQTAGFLTQATGLQGQLQDQYLAAIGASQEKYNKLLSIREQNISAAGTAGGLAQPVGQFGMLTNPMTGTPLNTEVFMGAMQEAQKLVNSGTPVNDPSVQSFLSPFGFVGHMAFHQAMNAQQQAGGGGWNPAAQNTQATTNLTQGAQYQQEATQLGLVLGQMDSVTKLSDDFINSSGLNQQGSPFFNQQQNTFLGQLVNPSNVATYNDLVNQVMTYSSQILGASGLNPTDIGKMVDKTTIDGMTASQLKSFLYNVDQLGRARKNVLDQFSQGSYGGTSGYTGEQSEATGLQTGPETGYNAADSPVWLQTISGGVMNFGGDIAGMTAAIKAFIFR